MNYYCNILVILGLSFFTFPSALSSPHLTSYDKNDYKAGRQNWDIEIDKHGIVYFGNSDGLLYNVYGHWRSKTMSKKGLVSSIAIQNDTIWCGGDEFGFFHKQNDDLAFKSIGYTDGGKVWNIEHINNLVVFQTENKLIVLNKSDSKLSTVKIQGIWSTVKWNDTLWMVLKNGDIGYLEDEQFVKVYANQIFEENEVRKLFIHNNQIFIVLYDGGVYAFDKATITKQRLPKELEGKALFTGMEYEDSSYCLGTISDGFIHLSNEGEVINWVNSKNGLIDNTVLSMAKDELGKVWLGLDYGLANIELQSAIGVLFNRGATYGILQFKGAKYLATNKGLFKSTKSNTYELIPNTAGQVWNIKMIDEQLFICHNRGLFLLKDGKGKKIVDYTGFVDITSFKGSNYFVASTYNGLVSCFFDGTKFYERANFELWGKNKLIYDEVNECVWLSKDRQQVYQLKLNTDNVVELLEKPGVNCIFNTDAGIVFSDSTTILRFSNGAFKPDNSLLLKGIPTTNLSALDFNESGNLVAYIADNGIQCNALLPDGNIHSYGSLLKSINMDLVEDYETLNLLDSELWIASDRGVSSFNINSRTNFKKYELPIISSINIINEEKSYLYPYGKDGLKLEAGTKDLGVSFNINKSYYSVAEYRYRLSNTVNNWSEWSANNSIVINDLKGGEYRLFVQCKVNDGNINETSLAIEIDKLWFETAWLLISIIVFLLLIVFAVILLLHRFNSKQLQKQKKEFLKNEMEQRLALKSEQILQFTEIISHKNEFLNRVKQGLLSMRNNDAQRWVNLITEEVNNEKKEFLFARLISEVHQEFINRLSSSYPNLTSNDLRVLSYIKINLEKSQVCSLMNITPRSLDTMRSRLRKKLNLEADQDLNSFILSY